MKMLTAIVITLGCAAAIDDLRRNAISNWINLGALAAGLAYHSTQRGLPGLGLAAAGALIGFLLFLALYLLGAMGAGDLKLMAAFGSLLGPSGILLTALLAAPIGGLIAAAILLWDRSRRAIPYAPAIALGAWLAFLGQG